MTPGFHNYLSALVRSGSLEQFTRTRFVGQLLNYAPDTAAFQTITGYVLTHGKVPAPETAEAMLKVAMLSPAEPPTFYAEVLHKDFVVRGIKQAGDAASKHLTVSLFEPFKALEAMQVAVSAVSSLSTADRLHRFNDWTSEYKHTAYKMNTAGAAPLVFGWPTMDEMVSSVYPGDIMSLVARPGVGKTWVLCHIALHTARAGGKVLLFSMEMSAVDIQNRLLALHTGISATHLDQWQLSTQETQVVAGAASLPADLLVVDGNLSASIDDVTALVTYHKPALVLVDGAYLLENSQERDLYRKVAVNAMMLKRRVAPTAPVGASWQFRRGEGKGKKSYTLDDIAHADAIGQLSSIVIGMESDVESDGGANTAAVTSAHGEQPTLESRRLKVLKGRKGETGEVRVRWQFAPKTDIAEQTGLVTV